MDMRKLIAAGITGTLMLGGVGAAVADNHDVVEEIVEAPVEEVVEAPVEEVVEAPEEIVEVPEEEVVEAPEEIVEVPEVTEDVEVPELPEDVEVPETPEVPEVPELDDELGDDEGQRGPRNDNFGARVSADARGESDGEKGVDGRQISSEARAKRTTR
ncbi:MAG: hypothetical protein M3N11_03275 [Actinomycetota bacterium]|nr:hypothetical protein [Actinomycetota bacterium]